MRKNMRSLQPFSCSYPLLFTLTHLAKSFENITLNLPCSVVYGVFCGLTHKPPIPLLNQTNPAVFFISLYQTPHVPVGQRTSICIIEPIKIFFVVFKLQKIHSHLKENTCVQSKKTKCVSPHPAFTSNPIL